MRQILYAGVIGVLLLSSGGCSYLFYPQAKEFAERAKGADNVETLLNLTAMMESSAKARKADRAMTRACAICTTSSMPLTTRSARWTRPGARHLPLRLR